MIAKSFVTNKHRICQKETYDVAPISERFLADKIKDRQTYRQTDTFISSERQLKIFT